jgi:hypothetical protein
MSNPTLKELLRCETERLVEIASKYGLSDPRTVAQSGRVDELITRIMRRRLNQCTKNSCGLSLNSFTG